MNALHPIEAKEVKGIKSILIHLYCYLIVFISYAPQLYVIYTSFQNTSGKLFTKGYSLKSYTEAFSKVVNAIQNTFNCISCCEKKQFYEQDNRYFIYGTLCYSWFSCGNSLGKCF